VPALTTDVAFGRADADAACRDLADDIVVHGAVTVVIDPVAGEIAGREWLAGDAAVVLLSALARHEAGAQARAGAAHSRRRHVVLIDRAVAVAVDAVAVGVGGKDRGTRHAGVHPLPADAADVAFSRADAHTACRHLPDDVVVYGAVAIVVDAVAGEVVRGERLAGNAAVVLLPTLAGHEARA
jgi:hypothetical protein